VIVPLCYGETAYLPLTRGKYSLIDKEDWDIVNIGNWFVMNSGYACRNKPTDANGKRGVIQLHRLVLGLGPATFDTRVDHINGNKLDNRKANLRVATTAQNCANRTKKPKHQFWGVYPEGKKFRAAYAGEKGKTMWIGWYDDPVEAAIARDDVVYEKYGEFATLNFPRGS
jgi:hypothetical protein